MKIGVQNSELHLFLSQILDYHFLFSILKEFQSTATMDEASYDALTSRSVYIFAFAAREICTIREIVVQ
jgi:hypothetical protein